VSLNIVLHFRYPHYNYMTSIHTGEHTHWGVLGQIGTQKTTTSFTPSDLAWPRWITQFNMSIKGPIKVPAFSRGMAYIM